MNTDKGIWIKVEDRDTDRLILVHDLSIEPHLGEDSVDGRYTIMVNECTARIGNTINKEEARRILDRLYKVINETEPVLKIGSSHKDSYLDRVDLLGPIQKKKNK